MTNKTLQLALGGDTDSIVFGNYKIEKDYKANYIKEFDKTIGVIVDGEIFINGLWKKLGFEAELAKNEGLFINLIEKRIKDTEKKKSDLYRDKDKLERENKELKAKVENLQEKIVDKVENDVQNLVSNNDKKWQKK